MIVFFVLQKQFAEGITGAVKIIKTDDPHMSRKAAADAAACF